MSDDINMNAEVVRARHVSTFQPASEPNGAYHIHRQLQDEEMTVAWHPSSELSAEELASALEETIRDAGKMKRMRYSTDGSARTSAERQWLGLPSESPLSSLKGNQLEQTKYHVPGLHSPYAYVSDDAGGIFILHCEDGNLHSLNVSYWGGPRVWITIIPQHRAKVEKHIRGWRCAQRARHASLFIPRSLLDEWGISYNVFLQRPRETVVVSGHTLHQGGTLTCSVAEAVNYGPPGWDINGYNECSVGRSPCPGFPIPNEYLEFLPRGERQRDQLNLDTAESEVEMDVQVVSTDDDDHDGDARDEVVQGLVEQLLPALPRHRSKRKTREHAAATHAHVNGASSLPTGSKKRQANTSLPRRPSKVSRPTIAVSQELMKLEQQIKSIDKLCRIPSYDPADPPTTKVVQLVAAIWSRPAIRQHCAAVSSQRQAGLRDIGPDPTGNNWHRMITYAKSITNSQDRSVFEKLSIRLHQRLLAQELELSRGTRRRNDSKTLDAICQPCGWSRDNLEYHRKRGLKWARVCGPYSGLLSFIPIGSNAFGISPEVYLELDDTELHMFHRLLQDDYSRALSTAGNAFESSLRWDVEDVSFRWEEGDAAFQALPEKSMLDKLQPFPSDDVDLYEPAADWVRPTDWPTEWEWPVNPTTVMADSGPHCDFCREASCECFRIVFANHGKAKPRIRHYGKRGRGLQAVANVPGQAAYKTRHILGRLSGKLVPVDTPDDGWTVELSRPDLPQAEPVCHLSCLTRGSNFRLLNHSCNPSTTFQVVRASGQFVFAVVALRDIYHGEELTVSYGKGYFTTSGMPCLCEKCRPESLP
ncbi:uncharacterized protein HMPREF1541_09022 [Cyphellophora europaea CBS 101466]|uniref:SET domain-containing protein n=1 Tax=Cyphellophora europaea (strain CBS 101466) TaxID=1220924 RepID=W2RLY3_CYPE1|nr:uncharacterized protein HMPREF1541_09022 [Cyphellophora europaea CBS 101466]ETN36744.1 hypothetical protein HMPREF1541_09022 [Cyphellophora europaea CBS 101466]